MNAAMELIDERRSLILATCTADGSPLSSYAPFVFERGRFYIFVSRLAGHTSNLLDQPRCSVLLIEDESPAENIFARKRLSVACLATALERTNPRFTELMSQFRARFGAVMDMLESLPDFVLFELTPTEDANLVQGFAQASSVPIS